MLKLRKVEGKGVGDIYKGDRVSAGVCATYLLGPALERPQETKDELLLLKDRFLIRLDFFHPQRCRRQNLPLQQVNVTQAKSRPIEDEEL